MAEKTGKPESILSGQNHLFELARTGELRLPKSLSESNVRVIDRFIYPAAVIIFGLSWPVLLLLLLIPLVIIFLLLGGDILGFSDYILANSASMLIVLFAPIYLFVWLWLWLFEKRPLRTAGFERGRAFQKYLRGLLIGLGLFSVVLLILLLVDAVEYRGITAGNKGPSLLLTGLFVFLGWMIQGGAEETITRGFLLPILGIRYGAPVGIAVSSLIFSTLHLFNPGITLLAVVNLLLFSIFAALLAIMEGGLWGIAAAHGIWNWAQGSLFGLQVSGMESGAASLMEFASSGPDWLTGGEFGPEGGLVVTAVYAAAIGLLILIHHRRQKGL